MRIAHFSDVHCTINPLIRRPHRVIGKRIMGSLNYFFGGRRTHFSHSDRRLELLLADVDAQSPDHVVCTGDLTQMSFPEEFETAAKIFGQRLESPSRFTVIPGNHDRYTKATDQGRHFENWFGSICAEGTFPFTKRLSDSVTLVGLDPCRATGMADSSGLLGKEQLSALKEVLRQLSAENQFVIIALHYAPFRRNGNPDRPNHGLRDLDSFLEIVEQEGASVRMVIHGHIHGAYQLDRNGCTYLCSGSATDLYGACGYNLYDIDPEQGLIQVTRRLWSREENQYVLEK